MSWTDERVELLKKLWGDGLSASQIAAELGGVSRNAVIGKVHRLGLSGRAKSSGHNGNIRSKRSSRTQSASPRPARRTQKALLNGAMTVNGSAEIQGEREHKEIVAPEPLKLALIQLNERTCKWPIGDPATDDFHFCGHAANEDGPYCSFHSKLAYQPTTDRRRDRKVESA